jgi:hypothetical protein
MKLITVVVPFKELQQRGKEETSHVAARQADKEGRSLYETFVFLASYETLFRSYFNAATACLAESLATYTKLMPAAADYDDLSDNELYEDYIVQLPMPENFNHSYAKPVSACMADYVLNYVVARWFETKIPAVAQPYVQRYTALGDDIKRYLNKRIRPIERPTGYWF